MKTKSIFLNILVIVAVISCAKTVDYSEEFIGQTSGRYLYTPDEVVEVYFENNKLFLKWRGVENIKPVILDETTFFVADMYKKLRFVQHPITSKQYLAIVNPDNEELITYDYLKLDDSTNIPSVNLKNGNYKEALTGYLEIKKQDSTSSLINEGDFNRIGYKLLRENKYDNAIEVFKINVALYPESSNVYDSLAEAYLRSGDSLQAFNFYNKSLDLNTGNRRAEQYIEAYNNK